MILPDVNILVNAFRPESPQHSTCRRWLDETVMGQAAFAISKLSLAALVRITTGAKFYGAPSSIVDAVGFCEDILANPNCFVIEPGSRHWRIFCELLNDTRTSGPRVTDAWYAALAIEHGCEWITLDRDFARFTGLRWSAPSLPA